MQKTNLIDFNRVVFGYPDGNTVLKGFNLKVASGEIIGLLGENGSGKTTTFNLLSGLLTPDEGSVNVLGMPMPTHRKEILQKSAYLPDESLLYPQFSALENMNMFALLWGIKGSEAKEKSEILLKEVGLWDIRNQWVKSYSKGMKQKLSICTALIHNPQLLLMDEPFNGLDITAGLWARGFLKEFVSKFNKAIVFTSHLPELVQALATRVVILHNGQEVFNKPTSELIENSSVLEVYKDVTG